MPTMTQMIRRRTGPSAQQLRHEPCLGLLQPVDGGVMHPCMSPQRRPGHHCRQGGKPPARWAGVVQLIGSADIGYKCCQNS